MTEPRPERSREEYERGLPDHHDPTAGFGGAPPAQAALTLRLVLAGFGLAVCVAGGIVLLVAGEAAWVPVVLFMLAAGARAGAPPSLFMRGAVARVALALVARRKARGEPG